MTTPIKILSLGGGLDSFAMLLDAIDRGELPDAVAFCDVGDPADRSVPGEWPSTYRHIDEVVKPLCAEHGIPFVTIDSDRYLVRGRRSLFDYFRDMRLMPSRMSKMCTAAAKVERFVSWLDDTYADQDVEVWIGFEAGEENRAKNDPRGPNAKIKHKPGQARRRNRWPLMERGLCRCRCEALVRRWNLPVPRKSACVFCPLGSKGDFKTMRRELPETFATVVELESNCRRTKAGHEITFGKIGKGPATLPVWTDTPYTSRKIACETCGAAERATKATGCDYLT